MNNKKIIYHDKELIRINRKKVYNIINNKSKLKKDIIIYTLPSKLRYDNNFIGGFFELEVEKSNIYRDAIDTINELNEIAYYNCNNESGNYLVYYIESGVINE